jgi:phage shock protein A
VGLDDEAFKKFDRLREKVEMAEAEAEALAELRGGDADTSFDRIDDSQAADADIEDELRKLKGQSET